MPIVETTWGNGEFTFFYQGACAKPRKRGALDVMIALASETQKT
jgi:hypothetical protein